MSVYNTKGVFNKCLAAHHKILLSGNKFLEKKFTHCRRGSHSLLLFERKAGYEIVRVTVVLNTYMQKNQLVEEPRTLTGILLERQDWFLKSLCISLICSFLHFSFFNFFSKLLLQCTVVRVSKMKSYNQYHDDYRRVLFPLKIFFFNQTFLATVPIHVIHYVAFKFWLLLFSNEFEIQLHW